MGRRQPSHPGFFSGLMFNEAAFRTHVSECYVLYDRMSIKVDGYFRVNTKNQVLGCYSERRNSSRQKDLRDNLIRPFLFKFGVRLRRCGYASGSGSVRRLPNIRRPDNDIGLRIPLTGPDTTLPSNSFPERHRRLIPFAVAARSGFCQGPLRAVAALLTLAL